MQLIRSRLPRAYAAQQCRRTPVVGITSQRAVHDVKHNVRTIHAAAKPDAGGSSEQQQEDFEGLLPEEDFQVPGNYMDAMSGNTKLGKAVRAAVEELEHLGDLESEVLVQCDDLLKKLGMKGSIFGANPPPQVQTGKDSSSSSSSSCNSSS